VILWGQMHNWVTAKITEFLSLKWQRLKFTAK
jgi:hypothetical protein